MDRPGVDFAFAAVAGVMVDAHAAIDRLGEARIELGRSQDQPGIDRAEKLARRRRRHCAVDVVEHAVAEDPMMGEVVGDGDVEGLVEVAEPFRRPQQDRRRQDREDSERKGDAGAAGEQPLSHGADGATGGTTGISKPAATKSAAPAPPQPLPPGPIPAVARSSLYRLQIMFSGRYADTMLIPHAGPSPLTLSVPGMPAALARAD